MIPRELYMRRIRPFIGTDLIKVMTGMRRAGKSVMLELIQEELVRSGVSRSQFLCYNFELCTATDSCGITRGDTAQGFRNQW